MPVIAPAMLAALTAAARRPDGQVLTGTRTHRALERAGWVQGTVITEAGRRAVTA